MSKNKLTRRDRRKMNSAKGQREIAKRQRIAERALQAINDLPLKSRLSFCWAVIRRRV